MFIIQVSSLDKISIYWATRVPRLMIVTPFWLTSNLIPLIEATWKLNCLQTLPSHSQSRSSNEELAEFKVAIILEGAREFYRGKDKVYPTPRKNTIAFYYLIGYSFLLASMIAGVANDSPGQEYLRFCITTPLAIGSTFALIVSTSTLHIMIREHRFSKFQEYPRAITMVIASTTTLAANICGLVPNSTVQLWGGVLLFCIGQLLNTLGGLLLSIEDPIPPPAAIPPYEL